MFLFFFFFVNDWLFMSTFAVAIGDKSGMQMLEKWSNLVNLD